MGAVCCCFQVDFFEGYENLNSSIYRNCSCLHCLLQNFVNLYNSLFNRGQMHPIPSSVESATTMTSTTSVDDSLSNVYRSPPRPLPYDADPRCFRFASRHDKGSSHLGEEAEPLRGDDDMNSESLGKEGKWNKSDCEDGSKKEYSRSSLTISRSKPMLGIEIFNVESEDEDVCPTCLEEYTMENPRITMKCSHHFHLSCIYEWMERSDSCPVCGKVMVFEETP